MSAFDLFAQNLLSPAVLAFALGALATWIKSDLELPPAAQSTLSIYLLFAIGFKGGLALAQTSLWVLITPILVTIAIGLGTCWSAYALARRWIGADRVDAAALAAHYGSVSALTFIAAKEFASHGLGGAEGYLIALVAVLEVPAIVLALWLGRRGLMAAGAIPSSWHEVLTGRSMVLLLGGLLIGALAGPERSRAVAPVFLDLFQGALVLFLLDMGMAAAKRLREVRKSGWRMPVYALVLPGIHGLIGTAIGHGLGFSPGGAAVFGTMVASASYIAAPAAVRLGLPQANPSLYLTASLGITFPFNLVVGIPLYAEWAAWLSRTG